MILRLARFVLISKYSSRYASDVFSRALLQRPVSIASRVLRVEHRVMMAMDLMLLCGGSPDERRAFQWYARDVLTIYLARQAGHLVDHQVAAKRENCYSSPSPTEPP